MTRIFEAYKKRSAGKLDWSFDLASLGEIRLFPPPPQVQQAELSQLADMLLKFKPLERGIVICFASSVPGEGASYVSYNTAALLAYGLQRRVAWVDVNFMSPQPKLLNKGGIDFADLLTDPAKLEKLPADSGLALVPGGVNLKSQAAQYGAESIVSLLQGFASKFEITILDCPPILQSIETSQLAAASDGIVVVIESRRLKHEIIRHGLDSLSAKQVNVMGAVLNRRAFELPKIIYNRL